MKPITQLENDLLKEIKRYALYLEDNHLDKPILLFERQYTKLETIIKKYDEYHTDSIGFRHDLNPNLMTYKGLKIEKLEPKRRRYKKKDTGELL